MDGNEYEFDGLDWLERYLTPAEDWLGNGESAYTAKLSLPILGIQTSAAMGQLVTLDGANEFTNDFTRFEVGGFNWAGIEAGVLYDRRTDQNDDVDNTMRATFGTTSSASTSRRPSTTVRTSRGGRAPKIRSTPG